MGDLLVDQRFDVFVVDFFFLVAERFETLKGLLQVFFVQREAGLIDEYRLYYRPFVLGSGKPFFVGSPPPLRFAASEQIGDAVRLSYVPK